MILGQQYKSLMAFCRQWGFSGPEKRQACLSATKVSLSTRTQPRRRWRYPRIFNTLVGEGKQNIVIHNSTSGPLQRRTAPRDLAGLIPDMTKT